jgi:hypothetical protein
MLDDSIVNVLHIRGINLLPICYFKQGSKKSVKFIRRIQSDRSCLARSLQNQRPWPSVASLTLLPVCCSHPLGSTEGAVTILRGSWWSLSLNLAASFDAGPATLDSLHAHLTCTRHVTNCMWEANQRILDGLAKLVSCAGPRRPVIDAARNSPNQPINAPSKTSYDRSVCGSLNSPHALKAVAGSPGLPLNEVHSVGSH